MAAIAPQSPLGKRPAVCMQAKIEADRQILRRFMLKFCCKKCFCYFLSPAILISDIDSTAVQLKCPVQFAHKCIAGQDDSIIGKASELHDSEELRREASHRRKGFR